MIASFFRARARLCFRWVVVLLIPGLFVAPAHGSDLLGRNTGFLGVGGSPELAGLELDGIGRVNWWHTGAESFNEGAVEGTVGWFYRNQAVSAAGFQPSYSLRGQSVGGAAFDDSYVFHTTPRGVSRRPRNGDPRRPSERIGRDFGNLPGTYQPGAAAFWRGELYFAMMSDAPILDLVPRGRFLIHAMKVGSYETPPEASSRLVADGSADVNSQFGAILKLGFVAQPLAGGSEIVSGLALTFSGDLLRFSTLPVPGLGLAAYRIASGVTDFAVRPERVRPPGQVFGEPTEVLYVTLDERSSGRSRLITLDPVSGMTRDIYTAGADRRLTAVGSDALHLFVSERVVSCGVFLGFPLCTLGDGWVRSKTRGDGYRLLTGEQPDANWAVVEAGHATHLRSDGQRVFFTRGAEVRRFPSDAPPLVIDFQPLAMEAVQAIQDLNNSVPLLEGKPAFVRAYARVSRDTSDRAAWFPETELRGRLNGTDLGVLRPLQSARIDGRGQSDIGALRDSGARTFLFELPSSWVRTGNLDLTFTVNPGGGLPEQGSNVAANNGLTARVRVNRSAPLQLVFHSVPTENAPDYNPGNDGEDFAGTIARALALMPAAELRVRFSSTPLEGGPYASTNNARMSAALGAIRERAALERATDRGAAVYHVGALDRRTPGFNGLGDVTGRASLVRMEPYSLGRPGYNTPYGGRTLAHELGHNLGRGHINHTMTSNPNETNNAPAGPWEPYPYDGATLGMTRSTNWSELNLPGMPWGFDSMSRAIVPPYVGGDLLSYSSIRWTSRETWAALLRGIPGAGAASPFALASRPRPAALPPGDDPAGPVLMVVGDRDPATGTITLQRVRQLPAGVIDPELVAESFRRSAELPVGLQIRCLDAAGAVLDERPLVLDLSAGDGEASESFLQFVPAPNPVALLEILDPANATPLLADRSASAQAPTVRFTAPPDVDAAAGTIRLEFELADLDGDSVTAALQFSADDGTTWQALATEVGASPIVVETQRLAGGVACRFRLVASDGFLTEIATTDPIALDRHGPELFVGGLSDGQMFDYGTDLVLNALAVDAEDGGLADSALVWVVRGPTRRSFSGGRATLRELSPGSYTAEAQARDSEGQVTLRTLRFGVRPAVVPDAAVAPELDGELNDVAYEESVGFPLAPEGSARVRLVRAGRQLYVGISGLRYTGQATPASFALRLSRLAVGGAAPGPDDLRFSVDEFGMVTTGTGDGAGFASEDALGAAIAAVVTRGPVGWSAELRIHEEALGGWNHAARVLFEHNHLVPADPARTIWPPDAGSADVPQDWAAVNLGQVARPAEVSLTVVAEPDGSVRLSWPAMAGSCILEQIDALTGTGWEAVTPVPAAGSHVTRPDGSARFYRLRCP